MKETQMKPFFEVNLTLLSAINAQSQFLAVITFCGCDYRSLWHLDFHCLYSPTNYYYFKFEFCQKNCSRKTILSKHLKKQILKNFISFN